MRALAILPWLALSSIHGQETWSSLAPPVARPAGFPEPSAVCFSSRWKHPSNADDPHDTFAAAAAFHATGFYWCNGPNAEYFREVVRRGYTVQGWLSTILPDTVFGNTRQQGRILDQQGELVTGPWMRAFKGWWGCMNSPEYRQVYLDYIKTYLDAGCTSLQMDDPGQNMTAVAWGGCWCPHCREKAARLGKQPPKIQASSTHEFYRDMRQAMDDYAGRHVPFSCNAHPGEDRFFDDIFDYGMQELNEDQARPGRLHAQVKQAESHGKAILYTYVSKDLRRTRATIALAYALGTHLIVPWDVYLGTGVPRQFGEPEDYADLYAFARGAAEYLDEYTEAAMIRPHEGPVTAAPPPVTVAGASPDLALFVRAQPGRGDAPVVIHAVETGQASQPFQLRLDPAKLFGTRPVTLELLEPQPYDAAAHAKAEETKDFAPLVRRRTLASGFVHTVDLPALQPWGLIVVSPAAGAGLWPPYLAPEADSLQDDRLRVAMATPAVGAAMHYTVDGTVPTAASLKYAEPLALVAETTVRAVTVSGGVTSEPVAVTFRKRAGSTATTAPDAVPGLRLWLRADDLLATHAAGAEVASWPGRVGPELNWEPTRLYDGRMSTPPVVTPGLIGGRAALRFGRETDLLQIRGFANQHLTKGFTILLVCRSQDSEFGLCGNSLNGAGGVPRLYVTRAGLTYHATRLGLGADDTTGALLTFSHDGAQTVEVGQDGRTIARQTGPEFAVVKEYGGGNLAIPFWIGNRPRLGDVAELVIYDRVLDAAEREAVSRHLVSYYRLGGEAVWD